MEGITNAQIKFQSTHPVWGGTPKVVAKLIKYNISIHPPRVGWDPRTELQWWGREISIHPPRVGWDVVLQIVVAHFQLISIHPPRVGWDATTWSASARSSYFNPPTPCGVGPGPSSRTASTTSNFNPPTPCGVGRVEHAAVQEFLRISIHPPRVGWDSKSSQNRP